MPFVLDAYIAAAWALPDETSGLADRLLTVAQTDGAVVPLLWWYEIRNILIVAERRKRIVAKDADAFLSSLTRMGIRAGELGEIRLLILPAAAEVPDKVRISFKFRISVRRKHFAVGLNIDALIFGLFQQGKEIPQLVAGYQNGFALDRSHAHCGGLLGTEITGVGGIQ